MKLKFHFPAFGTLFAFIVAPTFAIADPLDLDGPVKEASYESALRGYIKDTDAEVGGWKAANERVGKIGGWRTYLERAQGSEKPQSESLDETSPARPDTGRSIGSRS